MRELTSHKVNGLNEALKIEVLDEPGAGGACHHYKISGFSTKRNASDPFVDRHGEPADYATVLFQNGPIAEQGVNGISQEALLAIVEDRLVCFQAGPYANTDNALALSAVRSAMHHLHHRTKERVERGVEGTSEK